ncbi:hypothetical protein Esti_004904 [Eimeria stiedai]
MATAAPRLAAAPQTFNNFYKRKMCERNRGAPCAWGLSCNFAHSAEELRPFYDLTRTKMCQRQTATGCCTTAGCRFAHSNSELRSTETFFKTQLCIDFSAAGRCGNGMNCRHAHGDQELRAGPLPLYTIQDPSHFAEVRRRKLMASRKQRRQRQQEASKVNDKQQRDYPIPQDAPLVGSPKSALASTRLAESPLDQRTTDSYSRRTSAVFGACGLSPPPGFSISKQQHREKLAAILRPTPQLTLSPFTRPTAAQELKAFPGSAQARGFKPELSQSRQDCWLGSDPRGLDHLGRICTASKKMQERNDYCKAVLALSERIQNGLEKRQAAQAAAAAAATEKGAKQSSCVLCSVCTVSHEFQIREALQSCMDTSTRQPDKQPGTSQHRTGSSSSSSIKNSKISSSGCGSTRCKVGNCMQQQQMGPQSSRSTAITSSSRISGIQRRP